MRTPSRAIVVSLSGLAAALIIYMVASRIDRPIAEGSALLAAQQEAARLQVDPDTLVGWERGPAQPVLFSHRRHAGVYEIDCLYCHSNSDRSQVAPMPSVQLCLGCHRVIKAGSPEIQRLRGYEQRGEPVPWERIYKLADFVQFNHMRHVLAELECQECHGPVEETDVLYRWAPLTMGWCLKCHWEAADSTKLARAANVADRYYEPGREAEGLYSKSIDSDYGVTRAPIDCVACHY